jgi:hypothetical protein
MHDKPSHINIGDTVKYVRRIPGHIDKDIFRVVQHAGEACLREAGKGYYIGAVTWRDVKVIQPSIDAHGCNISG